MIGGPLAGLTVVEMSGIGPVPFCAMLLADLGACVVRVDRVRGGAGALPDPLHGLTGRGRSSLGVDVKLQRGRDVVVRLAEQSDVLLEGYRPGVMERLGLGPDDLLAANPRLVYGRMTGWGQDGPYASMAGHDINYIGLSGALHAIGVDERPVPPLNLVGDYGGGSLYLALGVLAALFEREHSGRGQVVDAAIVDGAASLMTIFYELRGLGFWSRDRESNLLDGGAPFYRTYETADGRYMAVGALEPQFYAEFVRLLGVDAAELPGQLDASSWPLLADRFAAAFLTKTREEWCRVFDGSDACVTPVLELGEVAGHDHNRRRRLLMEQNGRNVPAPAPRFSRSTPVPGRPGASTADDDGEILVRFGYSREEVADLRGSGIVR